MRGSDNVEMLKEWYATMDRRFLHDEYEMRLAPGFPNGGTYRGAQGMFEDWWPKHAALFTAWKARPREMLDAGHAVTVLGDYHGRMAGTDKEVHLPFVHVWRIRDGRLAALDQICDTLRLHEMLMQK
jgi:ketosteroid isomerase-like protein